ncbi:MAG: hypothetical protein GY811_12715 [Myxococcales bacterium]|nr:hypothetical protein [Myxococcales bacterium]
MDLVGALEGCDVVYTPAQTVNLEENEVTSVIVSVAVPTNAQPGTGALTLTLSGALATRAGNAQMNVANQVTFDIAAGAGDHGFAGALVVRQGTRLVFSNSDSIAHRIHSDPHGGDFGPGQTYSYEAKSGTKEAYCHNHSEGSGTSLPTNERSPGLHSLGLFVSEVFQVSNNRDGNARLG